MTLNQPVDRGGLGTSGRSLFPGGPRRGAYPRREPAPARRRRGPRRRGGHHRHGHRRGQRQYAGALEPAPRVDRTRSMKLTLNAVLARRRPVRPGCRRSDTAATLMALDRGGRGHCSAGDYEPRNVDATLGMVRRRRLEAVRCRSGRRCDPASPIAGSRTGRPTAPRTPRTSSPGTPRPTSAGHRGNPFGVDVDGGSRLYLAGIDEDRDGYCWTRKAASIPVTSGTFRADTVEPMPDLRPSDVTFDDVEEREPKVPGPGVTDGAMEVFNPRAIWGTRTRSGPWAATSSGCADQYDPGDVVRLPLPEPDSGDIGSVRMWWDTDGTVLGIIRQAIRRGPDALLDDRRCLGTGPRALWGRGGVGRLDRHRLRALVR